MADGTNRYAYVGDNPVNRVDPSGTHCCSCWEYILLSYRWCRTHHTDWGCVWNCIIDLAGNNQGLVNLRWTIMGWICAGSTAGEISSRACAVAFGACLGIRIGGCIDTCTPRQGCWYGG